jgi:hypothetical protein
MSARPLTTLWTVEEDNQLRALAESGRSTSFAIAARLKRSKAAVHKRARKLGFTLKWVMARKLLPGDRN